MLSGADSFKLLEPYLKWFQAFAWEQTVGVWLSERWTGWYSDSFRGNRTDTHWEKPILYGARFQNSEIINTKNTSTKLQVYECCSLLNENVEATFFRSSLQTVIF